MCISVCTSSKLSNAPQGDFLKATQYPENIPIQFNLLSRLFIFCLQRRQNKQTNLRKDGGGVFGESAVEEEVESGGGVDAGVVGKHVVQAWVESRVLAMVPKTLALYKISVQARLGQF